MLMLLLLHLPKIGKAILVTGDKEFLSLEGNELIGFKMLVEAENKCLTLALQEIFHKYSEENGRIKKTKKTDDFSRTY